MKYVVSLTVAFIVSVFAAFAQAQTATTSFDFLCRDLLQAKPVMTDYAGKFSPDFRKAVSEEVMLKAFASLQAKSGSCVSIRVESASTTRFVVILNGDQTKDVYLDIVTIEPSGAIGGMKIDGIVDESLRIETWSDLATAFTQVDPAGRFGATLTSPSSKIELGVADNDVFAVGSSFKLYILGALEMAVAGGSATWNENLPINEDWKSLPSGIMQDWPAGTDVTLETYAQFMISISDNTATDHLIKRLGRGKVEAMFPLMGNTHASLPLLETLEMFKLKWAIDPTETELYVKGDETERRKRLDSLSVVPRSQVGQNGVSDSTPIHISTIEWFATPKELCSAMFWLADKSQRVRDILGKNTPFVKPGGHWKYIGYKGGSEPGVISMTYLLESQAGNRACLSVSWNNEAEPVSNYAFYSLMKKILPLAEKRIP